MGARRAADWTVEDEVDRRGKAAYCAAAGTASFDAMLIVDGVIEAEDGVVCPTYRRRFVMVELSIMTRSDKAVVRGMVRVSDKGRDCSDLRPGNISQLSFHF